MRRRVAITGLGCVTPLGSSSDSYLEGLRAGASGVRRITLFDPEGLPVKIAGEARGFDPADHIPAKDARHVARVVPMAIAAAGQALSSAGIDAERLSLDERRRIAVLLGSGGGPVEFFEKMYGHYYRGELKKASVYAIPTGTIGTLSSEISMRYGLKGPSHVVSTGCTSSADAIGYATKAIRYGERDVVLAGGADAVITRRHHDRLRPDADPRLLAAGRSGDGEPPVRRRPRRLRPGRGRVVLRPRGDGEGPRARGAPPTARSSDTPRPAMPTTA